MVCHELELRFFSLMANTDEGRVCLSMRSLHSSYHSLTLESATVDSVCGCLYRPVLSFLLGLSGSQDNFMFNILKDSHI